MKKIGEKKISNLPGKKIKSFLKDTLLLGLKMIGHVLISTRFYCGVPGYTYAYQAVVLSTRTYSYKGVPWCIGKF